MQAALAASIVLAGSLCWATWRETLLAAYWENELAAMDGQEGDSGGPFVAGDEAVDRLLKLGRPGLSAVVRAIGHQRDDVSRAAWAALDQTLSRAENGPPAEKTGLLEDLAGVLAENIDRLPAASRPRAAQLAMRIVALLPKSPTFDSGGITAACDRVLRAYDSPPDDLFASSQETSAPATPATEAPKADQADQVVHARTVLPPDHSMYLELAELVPPALPRADGTNDKQPRLLLSTEARPLATNDTAGANQVARLNDDRAPDGGESDRQANAAQRLRELDSLDVFARLKEPEDAQAATTELADRGFSPRQIEVGRHLVSHDAAERLRWTEVLPGIRGIDARFWLLRLSHDTNVHVRRSAVGLLATDRDPEVIRRLRQIAVEETDADLRDQAGRALEILEGE